MTFSDINIKNARTKGKPYKLSDKEGMYLFVQPGGGMYFQPDYHLEGKRYTLALGVYPIMTLVRARGRGYATKQQIPGGINPSPHKGSLKQAKTESAANSIEIIARKWGKRTFLYGVKRTTNSNECWSATSFRGWVASRSDILSKQTLGCLRRVEATALLKPPTAPYR